MSGTPQPIPYQGSKRQQLPILLRYLPKNTGRLFEPFVGSGALTIGAASQRRARHYHLGDSLPPLVGIWNQILQNPERLCDEYAAIWTDDPEIARAHFDAVRVAFNRERQPAQLLYLIARCVKNAIRFNVDGQFNQSPDRRRLGTHPATLRARVAEVHSLLAGHTEATCEDYAESFRRAAPDDLVYLDPPYVGVSGARDARYFQGLDYERFVQDLSDANRRNISYLVSFDGRCGERQYGPGLPGTLGLRKIDVYTGRSSQATLSGRVEETVESLYLSPALVGRLEREAVEIRPIERVPRRGP